MVSEQVRAAARLLQRWSRAPGTHYSHAATLPIKRHAATLPSPPPLLRPHPGLFFLGYALAQLPVTAACVAWGPRRCLCVILAVWGTLAASFSLVRGKAAFLALRFCLGLAEAGAYPAFYYQLSLFYPPASLGVVYTWTATATAAAGLLGGPLAAGMLALDGAADLRGWQWLFLVEGALPVALAAALPLILPASPLACGFLSAEEQRWLWESVQGERAGIELAPVAAADGRAGAAPSSAAEGDHRAGVGGKESSGAAAEPAAGVGAALRHGLADGRVWYLVSAKRLHVCSLYWPCLRALLISPGGCDVWHRCKHE